MKNIISTIMFLMVCTYSFNTTAGNFNYSYADIGLSLIDNDGTDAAGIGGQLSRNINDKFRVKLGYVYSEGLDVDLWIDDLLVSAGYKINLNPKTDLVVDAGFITEWYANNFVDDSDTSIYLAGLLRHKVDNGLEFQGGLSYQSLFDNSDVAANIGLIFAPDSNTSFGIQGTSATVTSIAVFMRINME